MKDYGRVSMVADADAHSKVYVSADDSGEVELYLGGRTFPGRSAAGFVTVDHSGVYFGTSEAFNASIIGAARKHLLNTGIIKRYETVGGFVRYEMV